MPSTIEVKVVSKTKHSKSKTEARSTQISKTKHPNLDNEGPYIENEAPEPGGGSGCVRTSKGPQNPPKVL